MEKELDMKLEKNVNFFSLKWSALLLLSLVLLVINTFFYQYHKNTLSENFNSHREYVLEKNNTQIQSLITQSSIYLQQVAELIPSLHNMQTNFDEGNNEQLIHVFDEHWSRFQIQTEIHSVGFIDNSGKIIQFWGNHTLVQSDVTSEFRNTLNMNIDKNEPSFKIFCFTICKQYAFIPVMANGKRWGSISVGRSLAEPIMSFSKTSSVDIGILTKSKPHKNDTKGIFNSLTIWQHDIIALSRYAITISILQAGERTFPTKQFDINKGKFDFSGRSYEVKIHELDNTGEIVVVYLEDITDALAVINTATRETLLTGIVGVILSEIVLLLVLWVPLSNLRRTADIIPKLATNAFRKIGSPINHKKPTKYFRDEIDIVDESIIDLFYKLEDLENNVEKNSTALSNKMSELTIERDFIKRLLNTAQVIIITQNKKGVIVLANKQAEIITGYSQNELVAKPFLSLISKEDTNLVVRSHLENVATGKLKQYENEAQMSCNYNKTRIITWLHSHIESNTKSDPVILSVGLDITERKSHEKKINWLAEHDSLTGLLNRRRFHETLDSTLKVATRYRHEVGLLFLDLDNFKHINDTLGHTTGDSLIKSVADCLNLILRESDFIARIGGDEFAIIVPITTVSHLVEVANKINKHLYSIQIPIVGIKHVTSASIGIAIFPEHGKDSADLLSNADLAMYQAKTQGKGCWHIFSKDDHAKERIEAQLYWHHKIVDALANDKFKLHYQPIVNILDGGISHYEVLIRMLDDKGEMILPTPFIEVAEKTGLIHDIDHFVLRQSIHKIAAEQTQLQPTVLGINLSAHSFSDPQLLPLLKDLLNSSKINPNNIVFEITETAALSDINAAAQLIQEIRDLGCRFALDDFGVGFSSFFYLKELPVDFIKIDGTFIQNLTDNRNDQIIVKAITDIAKEFGIQTIAEFVEDEKTLRMLETLNVNYAQGFHVGKPALAAA